MSILALALVLAGLIGCLPLLNELLQAGAAAFRRRSPIERVHSEDQSFLVLVPAHNEELLIEACVTSLLAVDYPSRLWRVVVIADNSSDRTAEIARSLGAECLERSDPDRRGKPWALAWAIEELELIECYDACIIIDADTVVDRGFASALARSGPLRDHAAQAYFGTLNEWESWLTRLGGLLARGRYEITYPGKRAAGLNCPLTGNGMCIGTDLLRTRGWEAFSLTENWELYARYTAEGVTIDYVPDALLLSQEARSLDQGGTQRQRWLAGRAGVFRAWARRIIKSPRISALQKLDALIELGGLSPVLQLVFGFVLAACGLAVGGRMGAFVVALASVSVLPQVLTTARALIRHPQPVPTILAFMRLPLYAAWRVALAGTTFVSNQRGEWRKTERSRMPATTGPGS